MSPTVTDLETIKKQAAALQVHTISSFDGELERMTTADDDAWMAESEGKIVATNVPMVEVWAEIAPIPPEEYMNDSQWQTLARSLMVLAEQFEKNYTPEQHEAQNPWFVTTPFDLSDEVISSRLNLINRYFSPLDTRAYLELTELRLAREHQRLTDTALFTPESLAGKWADNFPTENDDLMKEYEALGEGYGEVSSQNASERGAYGDSAPGSAIHEAGLKQELAEMEQFILQRQYGLGPEDLQEDAQEDLGDSDVPY